MKGLLILVLTVPLSVVAATYKCTDREGRVSYAQAPEPGKRCVEATLPPLQVVPAPPMPAAKPAPATAEPDAELVAARRALEEARRALAEQEAQRSGDERNYQRVLDRLKPYQDAVTRAEARVKELEQRGATSVTPGRPLAQ